MVEGPALKETRFHLPGSVKDTDVGSCFERPKRTDDKNIREMAQSSAHAGTVWHSEQPKSQKQKKKKDFCKYRSLLEKDPLQVQSEPVKHSKTLVFYIRIVSAVFGMTHGPAVQYFHFGGRNCMERTLFGR